MDGPSLSRAVDPRHWDNGGAGSGIAGGDGARATALLEADVSGDGHSEFLPGFHLHSCADRGV